ncbi:caspase family protein [Streptomyces aurantiacus]|uniref:caspase family protein n=1 Tax=Streptomyces aurantiacus TaxID=47760 RepID=UPI0006E2C491|nr:caspase family protein [Streptomyces aurantiacus]
MTLVFRRPGTGPQMHALVIGVGDYPYCQGGDSHVPPRSAAGAVGELYSQLLSTPASALKVAEWLLEHQADDAVAPLGSLDVLVSARGTRSVNGTDVQRACHDNVRTQLLGWLERCDEHPQNVALFFFTGHGYALETDQLLLLDDFATPGRPAFDAAFPLRDTYAAVLSACTARTVCFFVDACRTATAENLLSAPPRGRALLDAPPALPGARDAPLILSTSAGASAYGDPNGLTRFTSSLLAALSGQAAERRNPDGAWVVTSHLHRPILELSNRPEDLKDTPKGEDGRQHPQETGTPLGGVIRQLAQPPEVPFTLGCDPREALLDAHLELTSFTKPLERRSRPPLPELWTDKAPAGHYDYSATFPAASYAKADGRLFLVPPLFAWDLLCETLPEEPA